MTYLPFEHIIYSSKLNAKEIGNRIQEILETDKAFSWKDLYQKQDRKPYQGRLAGSHFDLIRIISYRNSFLPKIKGSIQEEGQGTKIELKMKLDTSVLVFMLIWCGGVGFAFLAMLFASISKGNFEPHILIPFGMLIFGYVLTTAGFKYESTKSKKFFSELFEAELKNKA